MLCVAMIDLPAFNRTWFCYFGLHCFIRTLSFGPSLRSGSSLHIEERNKYRFTHTSDLQLVASELAPSSYSLFPFQLPATAATDLSSNLSRVIYRLTYSCTMLTILCKWKTHSTPGVGHILRMAPKGRSLVPIRRHHQIIHRKSRRTLRRDSRTSMERCHLDERG